MANFTPRLTRPEAGNKYYITKSKGGWSDAIPGSPTDAGCNVLSNCVGYAYGRFNEIGGYGCCKYLRPVNAENFAQYAEAQGLTVGQVPKLGACMVWRKGATLSGSDGAGHVAIVEQIISPAQIVTSESGWGSSKPFWTQTRHKGTGNWGMGNAYTFLGFIYQPGEDSSGTPSSASGPTNPSTSTQTAETYTLDQFVRDVQKACGAGVDGIAGPKTLAATVTISKSKNRRHAVVCAVQKRLYALGYTVVGKADGIAGNKFDAALKAFQLDHDCIVDGEVTARAETWRKLLGME